MLGVESLYSFMNIKLINWFMGMLVHHNVSNNIMFLNTKWMRESYYD